MPIFRLLLLSVVLFVLNDLSGQNSFRIGPGVYVGDSTQTHELILIDYSTMLGNCVSITGDKIQFKLRHANTITEFPMKEIRYLGLFAEKGNERGATIFRDDFEFSFSDATYHRTALPAREKGRVRVANIVYSVAEFNLNSNLQLGVGLLLPVGLLTTQRLRVGLSDNFHLGLSNQAVWVTIAAFDDTDLVGDLNLNMTIGNNDRFLNIGGGFLYELSSELRPAHLSVTAGERVSESWHIYGEMTVVDDNFDVIIIPALNASQSTRRHRWRFGVFTVFDTFGSGFLPLPLIGYDHYW